MVSTVIVPIDGSHASLKALSFAVETVKVYKDKIILLNVQRNYENLQTENVFSVEEIQQLQYEKGIKVMQEAIKILTELQMPFESKVRIGVATIEITAEAKARQARLIILGSRGNGPVVSNALGSVCYGVLHLSKCPVTIVPDRG